MCAVCKSGTVPGLRSSAGQEWLSVPVAKSRIRTFEIRAPHGEKGPCALFCVWGRAFAEVRSSAYVKILRICHTVSWNNTEEALLWKKAVHSVYNSVDNIEIN